MRASQFDLRREASVHYRMARLRLDQWYYLHPLPTDSDDEPAAESPALVRKAIRRATAALHIFKRIDDFAGVVRSRIMLARTLAAAGLLVDAQVECEQAEDDLHLLVPEREISYIPLLARLARARAELFFQHSDYPAAFRSFILASKLFGSCHDWSSQAAVHAAMRFVGQASDPSQMSPRENRSVSSIEVGSARSGDTGRGVLLLPNQRRSSDGAIEYELGDSTEPRTCC
jgi:hypothetical protein